MLHSRSSALLLLLVTLTLPFAASTGLPSFTGRAFATGLTPGKSAAPELRVTFLDVGQGAAVLIETPEGKAILVDGGEREAGEQVVLPYLAGRQVTGLDLVVLTHPHSDHVGGLVPVLRSLPVRQVLADGQVHTSYVYEEFLTLIEEKRIPFELARAGRSYSFGSVKLSVLHPSEPLLAGGLNHNSVVLRVQFGDIAVLLTGDLDMEGETRLLRRGVPAAQVLQVPHHGSSDAASAPFLRAVKPAVAVIQAGRGNPFGHPHRELLDRLGELGGGIQVYRTDQHGTVVVHTDGTRVWVETERPGEKPGVKTDSPPPGPEVKKIDINRASRKELESLPGIGPVLAQRIIEYREEHPFRSVDELLAVKGIGPKLLEKVRPYVTVES